MSLLEEMLATDSMITVCLVAPPTEAQLFMWCIKVHCHTASTYSLLGPGSVFISMIFSSQLSLSDQTRVLRPMTEEVTMHDVVACTCRP